MTPEKFNKIVENRLYRCKEILSEKNKEYSSDNDRLHNFEVASRITGDVPAKALYGMWLKHIVSIQDAIEEMNTNPLFVPSEKWVSEKLVDNINYTLLLEGVIADRREMFVPVASRDMREAAERVARCENLNYPEPAGNANASSL